MNYIKYFCLSTNLEIIMIANTKALYIILMGNKVTHRHVLLLFQVLLLIEGQVLKHLFSPFWWFLTLNQMWSLHLSKRSHGLGWIVNNLLETVVFWKTVKCFYWVYEVGKDSWRGKVTEVVYSYKCAKQLMW